MGKRPRNPEEYVFYDGLDEIQFSNLDFEEENIDINHKFTRNDSLNYYIDNKKLEGGSDPKDRERIIENLQALFNDHQTQEKDENFRDFLNENNFVLSTEEEFRQKNFKDFLELRYETRLPKAFSSSSLIPMEYIKKGKEKVEIHDDPSKLTGKNKHRATVLINKDDKDMIKGIQVICICGERINISFDYGKEDINILSGYEEQSPQE